ncbi:MAG: hypothetical protein R6U86_02705 [Bacteroidales bacterium]
MSKKATLIIAIAFLAAACGPGSPPARETSTVSLESETHRAFFDHLAQLCGQTFAGEQVFRSHHGAGWGHLELIMHVRVCDDSQILIPFHVGEDKSRTWMFLVEEGRLRFRHDHRHEDGTPEDETLYGGYADDTGTPFVQHFPADEYTGTLIEGGEGNVWTVMVSEDFSTFTYLLERDGEKRFRIDFDLTKPL